MNMSSLTMCLIPKEFLALGEETGLKGSYVQALWAFVSL